MLLYRLEMKDNYDVNYYDTNISEVKHRIKEIYEQIQQQKKKRQFLNELSISDASSKNRSEDQNSNKSNLKSSIESSVQSDFIYEQFFQIEDYMKQTNQQASQPQNKKIEQAERSESQNTYYIEAKRYKQNPRWYFQRPKSQKLYQNNIYNVLPKNNNYQNEKHQQVDLNQTKKRNYHIFQQNVNKIKQSDSQKKQKQLYSNPIYERIQQKYAKVFKKKDEGNWLENKLQIQNYNPNKQSRHELKIQLEDLSTEIIPFHEKRHSICLSMTKKGSGEYQNMLNKIKKQQRRCNGLKSRIRDISVFERIISDH